MEYNAADTEYLFLPERVRSDNLVSKLCNKMEMLKCEWEDMQMLSERDSGSAFYFVSFFFNDVSSLLRNS